MKASPSTRLAIALSAVALVLVLSFWLVGRLETSQPGETRPLDRGPTLSTTPVPEAPLADPMRDTGALEREALRVPRTGIDASNFYKNAFALYEALSEDEKKLISNLSLVDREAESSVSLFQKIQPIMDLLRKAAAADFCEWGIGPIRFDTPLTHITKANDLGRLALWNAKYRFPSDPSGAMEDLSTRAKLGHHLADCIIGLLVQTSFERSAAGLIRDFAGGFDSETATRASDFLAASSIDANVARAFAGEIGAVDSLDQMFAQAGPEMTRMLLAASDQKRSGEQATAIQEITADSQRLKSEIEYIRQVELQMAEALTWPEARFQSWWAAIAAEMKQGHPLANQMIPSLVGTQSSLQRTRIEREMMNAGIAILQHGKEQAARFRDPVSGAQFAYVPTGSGFDLQSTYRIKGKPVTMSFAIPR